MSQLLVKAKPHQIAPGVTRIHEVTRDNSILEYIEFKVLDLEAGSSYREELVQKECCIVGLTGKIDVFSEQKVFREIGTRESVFEKKPTDSVYLSNGQPFEVRAVTQARVALCYSFSDEKRPSMLIRAADNTVEKRGILNNQRLVHNILPDSELFANRLLVVEVFTESGNWSSYPPHKHDEDNLPHESLLEETYYHELNPKQGFVFQRVYTDDRLLDETMTVEHSNVVLVPRGYHPVGVPDGYTSYYLNVMAGPKRIWKFHNDPNHAWILERQGQ
ncbi:5-deoxy-glucuronate isomerase [Alicyclobacillus fastidiosus]|uniref:5-deoxy-glucuronate isomerase n=1 Tax=Alicyclobacillus fastidiosus TaxID=392011 RepID=A0ABY6ZNJ5_9BACL|nr:5-deoxy-glucuronate isomerase [Alicyclobacillus fastidiosus]WAH44449.1 5-deoxy-glucuronate isomerase [Alicyclobacillus fastidiosus]GMA60795.1 5-deoxy-glucuronate isomerase [Alicyclobacillus fastidiosus]